MSDWLRAPKKRRMLVMQFPNRRPVIGPCPSGPVLSPLGMLYLLSADFAANMHMHIITLGMICQSEEAGYKVP